MSMLEENMNNYLISKISLIAKSSIFNPVYKFSSCPYLLTKLTKAKFHQIAPNQIALRMLRVNEATAHFSWGFIQWLFKICKL